ncbi:MAG: hypothetical protein H6Q15_2439 [Bacteroidetes bacterium]|nr:hypothetical protein [Bacteroidota bacterium]
MKKIIFILLLLNVFCVIKVNSCNKDCDVNIDSLFKKNLSSIKKMTRGSSKDVLVKEREIIKFLYVISLLSDLDFMPAPHKPIVNTKTILAIESWYKKKKKYITCEKIKKAYSLLLPPPFKNIEELDKYSDELDQLRIKQ